MAFELTKIAKTSSDEIDSLLTMGSSDNIVIDKSIDEKAAADKLVTDKAAKEKEAADKLVKEKADKEKAEADRVRLQSEGKSFEEIENLLKLGDNEEIEGSGGENANSNQSISNKKFSTSVLNTLIKNNIISPFEPEEGQPDKPIEQYSEKELVELFTANIEKVRQEEAEKAPIEFFDNLSPELQIAATYEAKGGKDLKALFNYLAQSQEVKELDVKKSEDQEQIVRKWGQATGLTPEEIEDEVTSLKDMPGALEKKAAIYKPKLDAKQQDIVDKQLKDQELRLKQHEAAAIKYRENVLKTVQPGLINGVKITPTIQNMIYNGLVKADYQSMSGRNTNLLGHLLEKYQAIEPNLEIIAEVLWLLNDPKSFKEAIKKIGSTETVIDTVRTLKTAGSDKVVNNNTQVVKTDIDSKRTIKRQKTNLFSRT